MAQPGQRLQRIQSSSAMPLLLGGLTGLIPDGLYAAPAQQQVQPAHRAPAFRLPAAPALTFASRGSTPAGLAGQAPAGAAAAAAVSGGPVAAVSNLVPAVASSTKEKETLSETLRRAGKKALGGGIPGAAAMGVQVRPAGGAGCVPPSTPLLQTRRSEQLVAVCSACCGCGLCCLPSNLTACPSPTFPCQVLSLMWLRTTVNYQYRCALYCLAWWALGGWQ